AKSVGGEDLGQRGHLLGNSQISCVGAIEDAGWLRGQQAIDRWKSCGCGTDRVLEEDALRSQLINERGRGSLVTISAEMVRAQGVQAHSAAEPLADRRVEKDKCPSPPSRLGGAAPRRPTCAILPRSEGLPGGSPPSARPEYPLGNARGLRFRGGRRCGSRRQVQRGVGRAGGASGRPPSPGGRWAGR